MKKYLSIVLVFSLFLLSGCYEFESINQPDYANPNSTFDVPITVKIEEGAHDITPYFGILLPNGWSVGDSISYSGSLDGTLIYSSEYSDSMEIKDPAPNGYYWWVSVGNYGNADEGTCSFTPQIKTDDQTGLFNINYMIGYDDEINSCRSNDHPIWIWMEPPHISVSPDSLSVNLRSGQTSEQTITIENTGYHDLHFATSAGWKSALQFDGVDDYVSTPLNIDQSIYYPGLTLEAWVYPTSISAGRHHVISSNDGGYDWSILREGGKWFVYTGEESRNTGFNVDRFQWQHVAAVFFPGTGIIFYKNSQLNAIPYIDYDPNDNNVAIGRKPGYGEYFTGQIDEVRVWNVARTLPEIEADMHLELTGNEPGLIGY